MLTWPANSRLFLRADLLANDRILITTSRINGSFRAKRRRSGGSLNDANSPLPNVALYSGAGTSNFDIHDNVTSAHPKP